MSGEESNGANAFHDFERAGWERAAEYYGDAFGGLTVQTADAILDAVGLGTGAGSQQSCSRPQLLDVACGPGLVAAAAAARGADVTGLDFSAAMIAEARRRHPAIALREGDAESLPFDDESFDAVVMNFGLLHLARPERAIAEARRVLRAGGRYAATVWGPPERAVGFGMVLRAVQEHGNTDVPLPDGPPFFRFSEPLEFRRTLEAAGFFDVEVRELPVTWRMKSADAVFEAVSRGGVRTSALLRAQTPGALAAIRSAVRPAVETYAQGDEFVVPMPAVLASGRC